MTLPLLSLVSSDSPQVAYRRIAETINKIITTDTSLNDTAFEGAYSLPDTLGTAQYIHLGTWIASVITQGAKLSIDITIGNGYNALISQNAQCSLLFKTSNSVSFQAGSTGNFYADGEVWARGGAVAVAISQVLVVQSAQSGYDFYLHCGLFTGLAVYRVVSNSNGKWIDSSALAGVGTPAGNSISLPIHASYGGQSFSATVNGISGGGTTNVTWSIDSNSGTPIVTALIAAFSGTSNSSAFFLTGFPAAISPPTFNNYFAVPNGVIEDNGARVSSVAATFTSAGTLFFTFNGGLWTATGAKGLLQNTIIQYPLI